MKKKLVLFGLILCSLFGVVACNDKPFENMTITKSIEENVIDLNIKKRYDSMGNVVYDYNSFKFKVTVKDDDDDTNLNIVSSSGNGYVDTQLNYLGFGVTEVTVTPISYLNTGKYTLNLRTVEGNKSLSIEFNINLGLNDFYFKDDQLVAMANGSQIDDLFNSPDKYFNFNPVETTEKNVEISLAIPGINGEIDNYDKKFIYDNQFDGTLPKYAEIKNGVLYTYKTYIDEEGQVRPNIYPMTDFYINSSGKTISNKCITLMAKADYVDDEGELKTIYRFKDIIIIDECTDITLEMNANPANEGGAESIQLNKNSKGDYDVVLLDPNFRSGLDYIEYDMTRDLKFLLGNAETADYNPSDYQVVTTLITESEKKPICLSPISGEREGEYSFKVLAQTAGNYTHQFVIKHKDYPGYFDKVINVNFQVKGIPVEIKVNNKPNNSEHIIYDYYSNADGEKFKIEYESKNSSYKFFVFIPDFEEIDKLDLFKGDGSRQQFAKVSTDDLSNGRVVIEEGYSKFNSGDSFLIKHNLERLPGESLNMYVGIILSMAADSYDQEIREGYFTNTLLMFPIKIKFERGVKNINFTQSKYNIDLTNRDNILEYGYQDNFGILLLTLEEGQTVDKCIKSITYDRNLISVYEFIDDNTEISSLYVKSLRDDVIGSTELVIEANNGLVRSRMIETYYPTAYAYFDNPEDETYMPLATEIDKYSSGYLYSMSGKDDKIHDEKFKLYKKNDNEEIDEVGDYESVDTLFMMVNGRQKIDFYDYAIGYDSYGNPEILSKININDKVSISFNYNNYITYNNGVLYSHLITRDKDNPIIMTIRYRAGFVDIDEATGLPCYNQKTITKQIKIYIYLPLQGVKIITSKTVDLYVENSLSYFDKDKSTHTIVSNFIPTEVELGSQWNEGWDADTKWKPVSINYEYDVMLATPIINDKDEVLTIQSNIGTNKYSLTYGDLFAIEGNNNSDFTCTIECKISDELATWIRNYYDNNVDLCLKNIFKNKIQLDVNVYIQQFNKLQNINSVRITGRYASKVADLKLDIPEDGVYFEIREGQDAQTVVIGYSIDNADVANNEVMLLNSDAVCYSASIKCNEVGNSGTITLTTKQNAGIEYLRVVPKDNISGKDGNNNYTFYDQSLVKSFRVKVADGSIEYPFEIRTLNEFKGMQKDIADGHYFHYIISRDISLRDLDTNSIDVNLSNAGQFELSGKHTYSINGQEITRYSTLYNLNISHNLNQNSNNIGLFGILGSAVTISDVSLANVNVVIRYSGEDNLELNEELNVGILAGKLAGSARILRTSVAGSIRFDIAQEVTFNDTINIGGMIGSATASATIKGLPGNYINGISSTGNNVYTDIKVRGVNTSNGLNVGGLSGSLSGNGTGDNNNDYNNLQVVTLIDVVNNGNNANIGGVVGQLNNVYMNNIEVSPRIISASPYANIGGVVGLADNNASRLEYLKVTFVNIGSDYSWRDKANIIAEQSSTEASIGGIVGRANTEINLYASYVRSFYNEDYNVNGYKGNIVNLANDAIIGGLIGSGTKININKSYFDADLYVHSAINFTMLASGTSGSVNNSYAVGNIYNENNNLDVYPFVSGVTTSETYYVINKLVNGEVDLNSSNLLTGETALQNVTAGEDPNTSEFDWFVNANINTIKMTAIETQNFPIILVNGETLYDLVPTGISTIINGATTGIYDISSNAEARALMFLYEKNGVREDYFYEASLDRESSALKITLDGNSVVTTYIRIPLNDKIELHENSGSTIIELKGNRIYPKSEGVAVLTISSYLDKSIKTTILIKVVKGISGISLFDESNNPLKSTESQIVYVDEVSTYGINVINMLKDIGYDSYNCDKYLVQVINEENNNEYKISINGIEYKIGTATAPSDNDPFILNNNHLMIKGIDICNVKIKITPLINLDDVIKAGDTFSASQSELIDDGRKIYILGINQEYELAVRGRAKGIENNITETKLSPKNSVDFSAILETPNVTGGNNLLDLEGVDFVINNNTNTILSLNTSGFVDNCNTYELLKFQLKSVEYSLTNNNPTSNTKTYKVKFNLSVSFNKDEYRVNASRYDLNSIVYNIRFVPKSNGAVYSQLKVEINPLELNNIFTNFYSRAEGLRNGDINAPEENESNFLIPGVMGLLKITLDSEFNNSSFVTIMVDKKYAGHITLEQYAGKVNSDNFDEIYSYEGVMFQDTYETQDKVGIRLSKMSLNYLERHYFNSTYYVGIKFDNVLINEEKINFTITSHRVNDGEVLNDVYVNKSLTLSYLPYINATIDESKVFVMGQGTKKEIHFDYMGITKDINFDIDANSDNIYIVDDQDNKINSGVLSIEYLNSGRKYYLCVDVLTGMVSYEIEFSASEYVFGVKEDARDTLNFSVVDFEITDIKLNGLSDDGTNRLQILHGQTWLINARIEYYPITIGTDEAIRAKIATLETYWSNGNFDNKKELAEYAFTGIDIIQNNINNAYTNSYSALKLKYANDPTTPNQFEDVDVNANYSNFTLSEYSVSINDAIFKYYAIKGTAISNSTRLRLAFDYYYDEEGNVIVGIKSDNASYQEKVIEFILIVDDNSTYDHPNPIEDIADLRNACNSTGGNYILVNDIELTDWTPAEAKFDSLDGNGYVLKLKSFINLNSQGSQDTVNAGIFSKVSQNTLLKNIIVDVSSMLKNESTMLNDLSIQKNSTNTTYMYGANIDMSYVKKVNFGILAGENSGAITNAKIVNIKQYAQDAYNTQDTIFHILTTQGYIDNALVISNIGGIVGVNTSTGAISNSFAGVNINGSSISRVEIGDNSRYHNSADSLNSVQTSPFILAGGNNIGGIAGSNSGVISNTYAKSLGIYNTFPTVNDSTTGGLVANNSGLITSCFVEGATLDSDGIRVEVDDYFMIESTGSLGGLVYRNDSVIENSYANAYLETQSAYSGGFVYINNGTINNSYTTSINKNSLAHGPFTGFRNRELQNFGEYNNCYYVILGEETPNQKEVALALHFQNNDEYNSSRWVGFSFSDELNDNGIWQKRAEVKMPQLQASLTDTISFRKLINTEDGNNSATTEDGSLVDTVYDYTYDTHGLGSKTNPLIIEKASNFDKYIIDNANNVTINGVETKVFGNSDTTGVLGDINNVEHVRIVNHLDFKNINTAIQYDGVYLYQTIFAGVLDGNGMTLKDLNIKTDTTQLDNFGLFAQIGMSGYQSIIKNISVTLRTYNSTDAHRAGILAGTIVDSAIINVKINGNDINVNGSNMAGALAGAIVQQGGTVSLIDITVENVNIEATNGSLGGEITAETGDDSKYFFNQFKIKNKQGNEVSRSFSSLYDRHNNTTTFDLNSTIDNVSYAGGIAGVLFANNYGTDIDNSKNIDNYRSNSTIRNIVVKNNLTISTADNAGGLFGYLSEKSHIKDSKLILNGNQLIKSFNYAGGLVGENHGIIEGCTVAYSDSEQNTKDATIIDNTRASSAYNLFEIENSGYAVAIGGIAGYSSNGVIIDSYSKTNVVKDLAYIAGGIVGYSEGYNYLGYVYSTGTVYSKYITGGIIGLQVNDYNIDTSDTNTKTITNKVYMNNVVALNNWNDTGSKTNYRDEITKKLYNNHKYLYQRNGAIGYYNFYIKLPEIGNIGIDNGALSLEYINRHDINYVGSVIGKSLLRNDDPKPIDSSYDTVYKDIIYSESNKGIVRQSDSLFSGLYNNANVSNVYNNTMGTMTTTGALQNGTRVDSYDVSTFQLYTGAENPVNIYSYRIAYNTSVLNNYIMNSSSGANPDSNDYYDNFSFDQVFTAQEYTQQLLGKFANVDDAVNKFTTNIFTSDYNANDRFNLSSTSNNSFVTTSENSKWGMGDYLPVLGKSLESNVIEITGADQLRAALSTSSVGKTFVIKDNIELTITSERSIEFMNTLSAKIIGDGEVKTITFNVDNTSTVSSIFNNVSGASFKDINIVIKYNNTYASARDFGSYGLFANSIDGVSFNNCAITLNVSDNVDVGDSSSYFEIGSESTFRSSNIGLLFGSVTKSNLILNSFTLINNGDIRLNNGNIRNFGLIVGNVSKSTINIPSVMVSANNITLSNIAQDSNIGGLFGYVDNSTIRDTQLNSVFELTIIDAVNTSKNIASIAGYINNSNIYNTEYGELKVFSIEYSSIEITNTINLSLVAGKSYSSTINSINIPTISEVSRINVTSGTIQELNVGSIIGYDAGNSRIGNNNKVAVQGDISTTAVSKDLSVGGLVGKANNSSRLINNAYNTGNITVENSAIGTIDIIRGVEIINYAKTSVGGLVGSAISSIGISNVFTSGLINVTPSGASNIQVGVGGLVGYAGSNTTLDTFAVFNTFTITNNSNNNIYVSGVVGLNKGLFNAIDGYAYVNLNGLSSNVNKCNITNNAISSSCKNVFYAQELVTDNYEADSKFTGFAMADLYDTISEYSNIYKLNDKFNVINAPNGNISVYLPKAFDDLVVYGLSGSADGTHLFKLNNLTSVTSGTISTPRFNVIISDFNYQIGTIDAGVIISGRSLENGKVTCTLGSGGHLVTTNNGVISNIYLNCTKSDDAAQELALVSTNNGLITNCYVYGKTTQAYTLANSNTGRIYQSASSVVMYASQDNTSLFGLVNDNLGIISDCYSNSFGYSESEYYRTNVYGFANTNSGIINNCYYYIPEIMNYDNVIMGYAITNTGTITNCSNTNYPYFVSRRSAIWEDAIDNNTGLKFAQIQGIKQIEGAIVLRVYFNNNEISNETYSTIDKDNVSSLKYKVTFYQTTDLPNYSVVRITNASQFVDYINRVNGLISNDTIVLIVNDITINGATLPVITISERAMIFGIKTANTTPSSSNCVNITFDRNIRSEALISYNKGILVNITFNNLNISHIENGSGKFAPIMYNTGTIALVTFNNLKVASEFSNYVAGVVVSNTGSMSVTLRGNIYIFGRAIDNYCVEYSGSYHFIGDEAIFNI